MRIVALVLFIILLPISIVIAVLIRLTSGPNPLFKQQRIGRGRKEFTIYKFRTMVNDKITPIGRYLRKTGLDEIPQLINIIRGEMTLIGPRPLTQYDIDRLGWTGPECEDRWSVTPGITGLAQLTKICSADLSLKNDLYYARNKSIRMDIDIFWRSLLIPVIGKSKQESSSDESTG